MIFISKYYINYILRQKRFQIEFFLLSIVSSTLFHLMAIDTDYVRIEARKPIFYCHSIE